MKKTYILFSIFIIVFKLNAQSIDIGVKNQKWKNIIENIFYRNLSIPTSKIQKFDSKRSITAFNYYDKHSLVFTVTNTSNKDDSIYFFVGHWINFSANKVQNDKKYPLNIDKVQLSAINNKVPILKLIIPSNDSVTYEILPDIKNFNFNFIKPFLINPDSLNDFGYNYYINSQKSVLTISFIFIGILFAMLLYAFISWIRIKEVEYQYYSIYIVLFIIYFYGRIILMFKTSYSFLSFDFFLIHFSQLFGYVFYTFFIITFLHLKKEIPILYIILKNFIILTILYFILDIFLIYFTKHINIAITLYTYFRYFIILISIVTIYFLFRLKNKIAHFAAWGILMLISFGIWSLYFSSSFYLKNAHFQNFFNIRMTIYQFGILIELILFTMALQFKNNLRNKKKSIEMERLRLDNEKKEFETFIAVMNAKDIERTRIAQEIHDDIGAGLTNIRLMSEIAIVKQKGNESDELKKISATSSELIENMNEIIWSINSKNDILSNLVAYIRRYVVSYFENFENLEIKTNIISQIPLVQISGNFRRSVFLVIKEALHNIIKHSNATIVNLDIDVVTHNLIVVLKDNGKGFIKQNNNQFSNGLRNMKERIEVLGGYFALESTEKGTVISLKLPM